MGMLNVTMAKGGDMGSGSSLSSTMERKPLSFVMPTPVVHGPKLDGGDGGDGIGKHNHNGGGGGDDGGDDDDYFGGEDGDGEGGDGEQGKWENGFLRTLIPESYDALSVGAVFAEWMRSVADLPLIIRRAVEMGLFSSAQLVRFFSMDVRPGVARSVTRYLPPTVRMAHGFMFHAMHACHGSLHAMYACHGALHAMHADLHGADPLRSGPESLWAGSWPTQRSPRSWQLSPPLLAQPASGMSTISGRTSSPRS